MNLFTKNFKKNKIKILTYIEQNLLNIKKNKKLKKKSRCFPQRNGNKKNCCRQYWYSKIYIILLNHLNF